ncbi:MAG: YabP/YqfC family sporulation protein [Bacilli bacterium]
MLDLVRKIPFFEENSFKIYITKTLLNLINYDEILHFSDTKIIILINNQNLVIKGENLVISKLLENEILVNGEVKSIEIR